MDSQWLITVLWEKNNMALDPSLILDGKQPTPMSLGDWVNAASTVQGIKNKAADLANTQAQLPSIQAKAQMDQFAAKKQQDIKDIWAAHTSVDPDSGQITTDTPGAIRAMQAAGYGGEAQSAFSNYASNVAGMASAQQNASKTRDMLYNQFTNIAQQMNQEKPGSGDAFMVRGLQSLHKDPNLNEIVGNDPRFKIETSPIPGVKAAAANGSGVAVNGQLPTLTINPPQLTPAVPVNAAVKSNLPPEQQWMVDANDPNSDFSKHFGEALNNHGVKVPAGTSAIQASKLPGASQIVESNIIQNGEKATAAEKVQTLSGMQTRARVGITGASSLIADPTLNIGPGDTLSNWAARAATKPQWLALDQAISDYEKDTGNKVDKDHLSLSGAIQLLDGWSNGTNGNSSLGSRIETERSKLRGGATYGGLPTPAPQPGSVPGNPTAGASSPAASQTPKVNGGQGSLTGQRIRIRTKDGQTGSIDISDWPKYQAAGATKL